MPTGFIYVVPTVGTDYRQPNRKAVPTWQGGRLYFGPCKKPMRPRMKPGDYVFGISPANSGNRRVVFAARIAKKLTFAEAYETFPDLRGPTGPIHVLPVRRPNLAFPESEYEHIPGANHTDSWRSDLRTPELDAFFICSPANGCEGSWLGKVGPQLDDEILAFLRSCQVYGAAGLLREKNSSGTATLPVRHGNLYTGLHLETPNPLQLMRLVCSRVDSRQLRESTTDESHDKRQARRPTPRRSRKC